jgi:hypothetical protein
MLTVDHDVADHYRALADYKPDYGLDRAGSINIVLKTNREGKGIFQISLVDRIFRDSRRPLRPAKPATVNLNIDSVYDIVQKCRGRWEQAFAGVKRIIAGADGTDVSHYAFEENWRRPVDAGTFHALASKLAVAGTRLFEGLFESNRGTPLDDIAEKLREMSRTGERALTINAQDFHIPWRML